MAINTGKVVAGGLAAGVVLNIIDFALNMFVLGDRFKAQLDMVNPDISTHMNSTEAMVCFIIIDFLLGLAAVWTYAAIRPRFGPGSGTAIKAGLLVWLIGAFAWFAWHIAGMLDTTLFVMAGGAALVNILIGTQIGAMLYSED